MPNKVDRDLKHDRAVRDIAASRFDFPNNEHPELKTFVNEPEPTLGVPDFDDTPLFPDIVVTDMANVVQMLAEVETADTVSADEAHREWARFAELANAFYLYVPAGYSVIAKQICKDMHIKVTGIRTWRYIIGMDKLDVTEV